MKHDQPVLLAGVVLNADAGTMDVESAYNCTVVRNADGDYDLSIGGTGVTSGGVQDAKMEVRHNCSTTGRMVNVASVSDNIKKIKVSDAAGVLAAPDKLQVFIYRNTKLGDPTP